MANRPNGKYNNAFNANAAYDLSAFEVVRPEPRVKPSPKFKPKLELVGEQQQLTDSEKRQEERLSMQKIRRVAVVALILFASLGAVLFGEAQKNQLSRDIGKLNSQLSTAQSEGTRLEMQLNSIVSIDKIEEYATEKLGMVKMQKYQVQYVDLSQQEQQTDEKNNSASAEKNDNSANQNTDKTAQE